MTEESSEEESDDGARHSTAHSEPLLTNSDEIADKEAENALLQIDLVNNMIDTACDPERQPFRIRSGLISQIHKQTVIGIDIYAGTYRPGPVEISKSNHVPPESHLVPEFVEGMCFYLNENWNKSTAVHLSAYVLWKMNWIHPFTDGNGRTARAVSNLVLCAKLGSRLPGTNTVPQQIADNKKPYYEALEKADGAIIAGSVNVDEMEELLKTLLARQLSSIHKEASGI